MISNCTICGGTVKTCQSRPRIYCSQKCYFISRWGVGGRKHYCVDCGDKVSRNGRTRCRKCYIKYHRGKNHNNFKGKVKKRCGKCGKYFSVYQCCGKVAKYCSGSCRSKGIFPNGPFCGKHHTKKTKQLLRKLKLVNKSHTWKGGISRFPYGFEFSPQLKKAVLVRDKYKCAVCGMTNKQHKKIGGRNLGIHHINYNKMDNTLTNLVSVCSVCHGKTNFNRSTWEQFFKSKISNSKIKALQE